MAFAIQDIILLVIILALGMVVYTLKVLYSIDQKMIRIETHIETILKKVIKKELRIEKKMGIKNLIV